VAPLPAGDALAPLEVGAFGRRAALELAVFVRPPALVPPPVPLLGPLVRPAVAFRAEPLVLLVPAFARVLVRSLFRPPLRDAMMCSPFHAHLT
jgi:hypothetical protein